MTLVNLKLTSQPSTKAPSVKTWKAKADSVKVKNLTEGEFNTQIAEIDAEKRGVDIAIAKVQLEQKYVQLKTEYIKLGISSLNRDSAEEDFKKTAWTLVGKKFQTAIAQDNTRSLVIEHDINQSSIKAKLEEKNLSLIELQSRNSTRQTEFSNKGIKGSLPRYVSS